MSVQSSCRSIHIFLVLISFSLIFQSPLSAEAALDREKVIRNVLECVEANFEHGREVDWAEVCYTGDPIPRGDGREELIEAEMRSTARRMERESQYESEEETGASEQTGIRNEPYAHPADTEDQEASAGFHLPRIRMGNGEEWAQSLDVTSEVYYYKYTESIGVEDSGTKAGILAAYTLRNVDAQVDDVGGLMINMIRVDGRFSYGRVDYEAGTARVNNIPDYNFETRVLAGYDFSTTAGRLTPYIGFGYRYLFNEFSVAPANSTTYSGYDRESHYFYLPLGMELESRLRHGWSVQATSELDWFLRGRQVSHLEQQHTQAGANAGYAVLENDQDTGVGLRFALRLKRESSAVNLLFEPFVRYWHIKDSDPATSCGDVFCFSGFEPDNETWEYGVNAGVQF